MAVRIENTSDINFGTFGAAANVTHARIQVGGSTLLIRSLTTSRSIGSGDGAVFRAGEIDLVFPSGNFTRAGHKALMELALNGSNSMAVDLMTSSSQVVTVSGYGQQTVTAWTITDEAD